MKVLEEKNDIVVSIKNLSFSYRGGVTALKNVNLKVKRGELLVVMGANGAGKTTLCYLLSGIIPNIYGGKRRGIVKVFGFDPWDKPIYETATKVGIVLQDPETQLIMPEVQLELAFGPANLGLPKEEIYRRVEDILNLLGMKEFKERRPEELSGGEKQKVALGATLTMMPELLILDEPTSQLDPIGTSMVLSVLKRLKKEKRITIIMTTHKSDEAATLADKIMLLHEGETVAYGTPQEILTQFDLLEKIGVKTPSVSEYFYKLREKLAKEKHVKNLKIPITLDEAAELLKKLIDDETVQVKRKLFWKQGRSAVNKGRPIIEVRDLTYIYPGPPEVMALKKVNLKIYEGEFVGIVGQNGSGKTTLVKNIVGLLKPTEGKIFFKGKDISNMSTGEIVRKIGLVLQNPDHQLFTLSCKDEIAFGLKNIGVAEEEISKKVKDALKMVGLEGEADTYPFRLSFGDRRKLTVAAAIAMEPEVLILDEPTTAQDYRGRYMLADIAKKLNRMGRTVVMISHDMDLVARYADRLVVMKDGEILLDKPIREAFQEVDILEEAFLKPPQITMLALKLRDYGVYGGILSADELLQTIS